jgi:5-formyltetrahydrofolate cyclo-ligase
VLLPVVLPDRDLDWAVDDGTRAAGALAGVLEPGGPRLGPAAVADADVVVVPALAVDTGGRRLGQGGGSYDRALARVGAGALVVALLHDEELLDGEQVPVSAHDVPVHAVVTPRRTVRLTG